MARPPRIPVWLRADQPVTYFVTICEARRESSWANEEFFGVFSSAAQRLLDRRLWFVHSAVVMPDHLHLLASPLRSRDEKIGNLLGATKRWINEYAVESQWRFQEGGFDRLLRRDESAEEKWNYMRNNPVRAGLVADWKDWPWSMGIREAADYL